MRLIALSLLASITSGVAARSLNPHGSEHVLGGPPADQEQPTELYTIELSPGDTRRVTEEQKWDLKKHGVNFMDITLHPDLGSSRVGIATKSNKFPAKPAHMDHLGPLLQTLSTVGMRNHLETFTAFHTRYYKSSSGKQSSEWLLETVRDTIKGAGADKYGVHAEHFEHPWGQNSVIATIPGKSNKTIVIGAHQDSINLFLPSILSAPGADDDGSGTVTILEAFRVLLTSEAVIKGDADNTVEFHWYSAEEGGLLGSQEIFSQYENTGRDVRAMLQQDMTGFVQRTLDAGERECVGVITDFVDEELTDFIKKVITEYCDIPYVETKCGYACSDHASATKAGYPSAFVMESEFKYSDNHIHTSDDLIEYLSFDHMLQHAKLTLALAGELAFAELPN